MREYYTKQGIVKTDPTQRVSSEAAHWDLMESLISGFPLQWRPAMRARLLSIVAERNVASLLETISELDAYSQKYVRQESADVVTYDRRAIALLKKFPFPKHEYDLDLKTKSIGILKSSEEQCADTNARLRKLTSSEVPSWVRIARELIHETLGDLTSHAIMRMITGGTHGPGMTLSNKGNRTTPYYKYMDFPYTCTPKARVYAYAAISSNPRWLDLLESSGRRSELPPADAPQFQKELMLFKDCVELVDAAHVTFVPKHATAWRPIEVGASLNVYLQLGVKAYMQDCLQAVGVDLTDQTKNQSLARLGSRYAYIDGTENVNQYSTIDLASASDTISYEIVKLLLPADWFAFLSDLRHDCGDLDGERLNYERFSAMGNGYTFPLESLIFWAVTKAAIQHNGFPCTDDDLAVYGDDIICRWKHTPHVIPALEWCGFKVNTEKSFLRGPFKESCGADYFNGNDVRPFYLKREISTYEDLYFICNSLQTKVKSQGFRSGYAACYSHCVSLIPSPRLRVLPLNSGSDMGLRVPLNLTRKLGLAPWLTWSEEKHLQSKKCLKVEDSYVQSPYVIQSRYSPKKYTGYSRARLMLALDGVQRDMRYAHKFDILNYEASAQGQVTRRKSVNLVTTVRPIPNWDGLETGREIANHLAWYAV